MRSLTRLWRACESLPGSCTVDAHWRRLLGEEYLPAGTFLTPRQEEAKAYPCPDCGCSHRIVRHAEDDIVAVCQCDPKTCSDIPLRNQDIVLWEIDWHRLGKGIARAMGLQHLATAVPGLSRTLQIGRDTQVASSPVYLTVQHHQSDHQRVALTILARSKTPFVLLTPTMDLCPQSVLDDVRSSGSVLLGLSDAVLVGSDAQVSLSPSGARTLNEFRAMHAPQPSGDSMDTFPTPPGTPWEAIYMRFTDGHTLYIRIGDKSGHCGYADLGMLDRRSNKPTVHWHLLWDFAQNHGVFTWDHPNADPKKQKQKEDLAKILRTFFGIEGDPIRKFRDEKGRIGWECVFTIEPES